MLKVAAYCRVSTDAEDQANSLKSQKTYFNNYIRENRGWKLVDIYADGADIIGLNQKTLI